MKYIILILGGAALALAGPIPSSTRSAKIPETSSSNALINIVAPMSVSTVLSAVPTHTHGPYAVVANLSAADRLDAPGSSSGLWRQWMKKQIEEEKRTGRKLQLKEVDHELDDVHGASPSIAKRKVAMSAASWLHAAKEMMETGEPVLDMEEWSRLLEHLKEHEVKSNITDPPLAYRLERADKFDEIAHMINEEVEELDQLHKEGLPKDQFTKIEHERMQRMQDASAEIDRLLEEVDAENKNVGMSKKYDSCSQLADLPQQSLIPR